ARTENPKGAKYFVSSAFSRSSSSMMSTRVLVDEPVVTVSSPTRIIPSAMPESEASAKPFVRERRQNQPRSSQPRPGTSGAPPPPHDHRFTTACTPPPTRPRPPPGSSPPPPARSTRGGVKREWGESCLWRGPPPPGGGRSRPCFP